MDGGPHQQRHGEGDEAAPDDEVGAQHEDEDGRGVNLPSVAQEHHQQRWRHGQADGEAERELVADIELAQEGEQAPPAAPAHSSASASQENDWANGRRWTR